MTKSSLAISEIVAALSPLNFRKPRVGHFSRDSSLSQNWVRMILRRTKPEIYALRVYQIEIEGSYLVSSQVIGGWDSAELPCFVPCCIWKWNFHTPYLIICKIWSVLIEYSQKLTVRSLLFFVTSKFEKKSDGEILNIAEIMNRQNLSTLKEIGIHKMVTCEKTLCQKIFGTPESRNINAIYWHIKVTIRNRADCRICNNNKNIMEGECRFRRGLILERGGDLYPFLWSLLSIFR
jgi:hypothetical protein